MKIQKETFILSTADELKEMNEYQIMFLKVLVTFIWWHCLKRYSLYMSSAPNFYSMCMLKNCVFRDTLKWEQGVDSTQYEAMEAGVEYQ